MSLHVHDVRSLESIWMTDNVIYNFRIRAQWTIERCHTVVAYHMSGERKYSHHLSLCSQDFHVCLRTCEQYAVTWVDDSAGRRQALIAESVLAEADCLFFSLKGTNTTHLGRVTL